MGAAESGARAELASSHAWVSRNMRSYAATAELYDMDGMSSTTSSIGRGNIHELLPDVITKGTGPLSKAAVCVWG